VPELSRQRLDDQAIGYTDIPHQIRIPGQIDAMAQQNLAPAGEVNGFAIYQNSVEVEKDCIVRRQSAEPN
jgi:hypothetical protein